ncbi:MAG: hypothetical protein Q4B80_00005 [Aerococcaceae bacterium]|nr:hypothetical protein [Aerococcaceae bacterium]
MKKKLLLSSISLLFVNPLLSAAQNSSTPYVLTQSINNIPVAKENCVILIREAKQKQHEQDDMIERLSEELDTTVESYNQLNEAISKIESGNDENSMPYAVAQYEKVIEEIFQQLTSENADFIHLSQEEQIEQIQQNQAVQEWQTYISELEIVLNDKIAQRDALKIQHQQLLYDIETLQSQNEPSTELNQCLLYPYSTTHLLSSEAAINPSMAQLSDVFVELDRVLQQIVPLAYRQLTFDKIYSEFSEEKGADNVYHRLEGKQHAELDENGKLYYTYAHELSAKDIELLGDLSLRYYFENENGDEHIEHYHDVLAMKEGQFLYFSAINDELFTEMKQLLCDYLNQNGLFDETTVEQVRSFHQRYQLKLVYFDGEQWYPVSNNETGYLDTMAAQPLFLAMTDEIETEAEPESEVAESHLAASSLLNSLKKEKNKQDESSQQSSNEKLSQLKDKLQPKAAENSSKPSQSLPKASLAKKPSEKSSEKSTQAPKQKQKENKKGVSLPSTGEQRLWWWIAVIMLGLGVLLLIGNGYLRYKQRQKLRQIHLD